MHDLCHSPSVHLIRHVNPIWYGFISFCWQKFNRPVNRNLISSEIGYFQSRPTCVSSYLPRKLYTASKKAWKNNSAGAEWVKVSFVFYSVEILVDLIWSDTSSWRDSCDSEIPSGTWVWISGVVMVVCVNQIRNLSLLYNLRVFVAYELFHSWKNNLTGTPDHHPIFGWWKKLISLIGVNTWNAASRQIKVQWRER